MKTLIYFLLISSIIFLGCSKNDDDLNSDLINNQLKPELNAKGSQTTYTVPMTFVEAFTSTAKKIPIECDGVVIDHLSGTLDVFCRMFGYYPEGQEGNDALFVSEWMIHNYYGTLASTSGSGEIFEIQGVKKMDMIEKNFTFHLNIKGNLGSHYILFASGTNAPSYTFTIEKAVCPGSDE